MKRVGRIVFWAVIISFALVMGKDLLAKVVIEGGVKTATGLKLRLTSLQLGIPNTLISIKGLRLYNPKGFEDHLMVDMPEVYVDYHLQDILKGNIHLEEVRLYLRELTVIKNAHGQLNLDSLKIVKEQKTETPKKQPATKKKSSLQIDLLTLRIGNVVYKDYSEGPRPEIKSYHVDINEQYENITDLNALISVILVRALTHTAISKLTGFDLGPIKGIVADVLVTGHKLAVGATSKAKDAMKHVDAQMEGLKGSVSEGLEASKKVTEKTAKKIGEAVTGTASSLKETASGLKEKLKLPLVGKK